MDGFNEKVLVVEGSPIHYWTGGKEDSPWLIFMHGACVDHHSFDPILPEFLDNFKVLAWDARGHGLSQPMDKDFSVPLAVEDLLAVMAQEDIEQAVLIGHSNGTYIAQEMAFRHPEKVRALAILDGTCITWPRSKFDQWLVKASIGAFDWFPFETLKKSGLKYISSNKDLQGYAYKAYSQLSRRDFITIMKGVSVCLHSEPGYHISCPLLIMHGEDDQMGDIAKINPLWARQGSDYIYKVIPNARHLATLDNPEFVNAALKDFLSGVFTESQEEKANA